MRKRSISYVKTHTHTYTGENYDTLKSCTNEKKHLKCSNYFHLLSISVLDNYTKTQFP